MTTGTTAPAEGNYFLTHEAVRRAITTLKPLPIHETYPVFLHLRRRAEVLQRFTALQPDWQGEVHDWLDVPEGPPNKPHFRPFTTRGSTNAAYWMARNLPGSYSPASLRGMRTLYVDAQDQYILPTLASGEPDPRVIRARLMADDQVPAWALAAFLFRNRRFIVDQGDPEPGWPDLLAVFNEFFGWTSVEADHLFTWEHPQFPAFEVEV